MRPGVGVIASRWPQISIYGACGSRYRWDIDGSFSISPSPFSRFLFSRIIYTFSIIRCFHSPEGGRRRNGRKETRTISVLLHPEEFSTEIHRFPFRFRYKGKLSCWETKVEERERERNSNIKQIFLQILFLQIRRGKKEKSFSSLFLSLSKFAFFSNFSSKSLSLYIIQARSRSLPKKGKSWPIRRHPLATQRVSYRFPKRNKAVSRGFQVALRKEFTFSKTFYNSPSLLPPSSIAFPFPQITSRLCPKTLSFNFVPSFLPCPLLLFPDTVERKFFSLSLCRGPPRARLPIDHPPIRPLHSASRDRNRGQPERSSPPSLPSSFPSGTPLKGGWFSWKTRGKLSAPARNPLTAFHRPR